jgi:hypothetical protein
MPNITTKGLTYEITPQGVEGWYMNGRPVSNPPTTNSNESANSSRGHPTSPSRHSVDSRSGSTNLRANIVIDSAVNDIITDFDYHSSLLTLLDIMFYRHNEWLTICRSITSNPSTQCTELPFYIDPATLQELMEYQQVPDTVSFDYLNYTKEIKPDSFIQCYPVMSTTTTPTTNNTTTTTAADSTTTGTTNVTPQTSTFTPETSSEPNNSAVDFKKLLAALQLAAANPSLILPY